MLSNGELDELVNTQNLLTAMSDNSELPDRVRLQALKATSAIEQIVAAARRHRIQATRTAITQPAAAR